MTGVQTCALPILKRGKEMELNRMIDHTILKADASKEAVMQIIEEAKKYHFYSV